jgi:hypothetical protein
MNQKSERMMSLQSSQTKVQRLTKDLLVQWSGTKERWNDPVSMRFEVEYLTPLERAAIAATEAMDKMHEIVQRAKRECD